MNRKNNRIVIVGVVILALFLSTYVIAGNVENGIISGYGGITADIIDVNAKDGQETIWIDGTSAGIDPEANDGIDMTGVRCEVQGSPSLISKQLQTVEEETIDNGDGSFTKKLWEVYNVRATMGITIRTYGQGMGTIRDVEFVIRIQENDLDVFNNADEVQCYIMEVFTRSPIVDEYQNIEVSPTSGGFYFTYDSLRQDEVPQWVYDSGYQESIKNHGSVSFDIDLVYATPITGWWWSRGGEVEASWDIGIDLLCFGYWENTGNNADFNPKGTENFGLFGDIFGALGNLLGAPATTVFIIVMVVIVGIFIIMVLRIIFGRKSSNKNKR